jgi:hypothetical protein
MMSASIHRAPGRTLIWAAPLSSGITARSAATGLFDTLSALLDSVADRGVSERDRADVFVGAGCDCTAQTGIKPVHGRAESTGSAVDREPRDPDCPEFGWISRLPTVTEKPICDGHTPTSTTHRGTRRTRPAAVNAGDERAGPGLASRRR